MMPQFPKRSTRPLTAESYRVAAQRAAELASKIAQMADHLGQPVAGRIMTRAIRDLAMHAKRLDDRHRGLTGDDNARQD